MSRGVLYIVYAMMGLIGIIAMYSLLNAGNPDSLLRFVLPDPAHDLYVAMGSSLLVFILGFMVFYSRDLEGFQRLLEMNSDRIQHLRRQGKTDAQIADSLLEAMGSAGGYRHRLARKKLILYLSDFQ
ncbi:MAG: hypothetical protein JRI76_12740 [Deltaproteobacteria bacterium]|nr:hypothetical protein [Deltaproteobacteria bacterium]MBW1956389.1 hypothetical protein [Deltaproteobacteria bacterium]MBW2042874.1 hypothetical protein [Deltaproteobacteria bacterium]MBW2131265.1 hypothetical protein [Deltaproteobacteria bacterium]